MSLVGLAVGLVTVAAPSMAHANGRFPTSQYVLEGPGPATSTIALRTTFGIIQSNDGGMTWTWMCEQIFGYGTTPVDPAVALGVNAAGGVGGVGLSLGLPNGVAYTTNFCGSTTIPELAGRYTGDMTTDPTGTSVYWVGADSSTASTIWKSTDGGQTYVSTGPGVLGVTFTTIEVAPSNPLRMYLAGNTLAGFQTVIYRSDDGGMTLHVLPADLHGGVDAWISGVDSTNADIVYVRSHTAPPDGGAPGTMLLKSIDGGMTFSVIWQSVGDMKGFALSDDGNTVWAGGPDPADQLQRSDHGGPFHQVATVQVLCLRWHAGQLLVCGNDAVDGYALGRSMDNGMTIVPLLTFQDLPCTTACAPGTLGHDICVLQWPQILDYLPTVSTDAGTPMATMDAGRGESDAGIRGAMDAGLAVMPHTAMGSQGCAVSKVHDPSGARGAVWAVVLAVGSVYRRRRATLSA